MSRPSAGNYVIYSRLLSPSGQKLVMTFNGENQYATLEPFTSQNNNQVWMFQDAGTETQAVVPVQAANLQAAWGSQGIQVLRAGGFVWIIKSSNDGYIISDGGRTVVWGVIKGIAGEKITLATDQGGPNQRWVLEKQ